MRKYLNLKIVVPVTLVLIIGASLTFFLTSNPYLGRYTLLSMKYTEEEGFVESQWHWELEINRNSAALFVTLPNGCKSVTKYKGMKQNGATLSFSETTDEWLEVKECRASEEKHKIENAEIFVRKDANLLYWKDGPITYKYQKIE